MIACPAQAGEPHMNENHIHYVFVFEFIRVCVFDTCGFQFLKYIIRASVQSYSIKCFAHFPGDICFSDSRMYITVCRYQ